jgi:hypothetical protein
MYDAAMETRKECTEQLRQTDIDETSRSRANARLRRSNTSLEQCGDLRHELIDKLMARDMPLIKKILQAAANGKSSLEQIEAVLLKKGVYPEVVTRMKEPGGLLNPQKARAR